jgi:hypothetical protein
MIFHRILKKTTFFKFHQPCVLEISFPHDPYFYFLFCCFCWVTNSLDKSLLVLFFKPDELVLVMGYYSVGEGHISVAVFDFTFHSNPNEML